MPNRMWGGQGLLGCVFGYGLLHRIPETPAGAAENVIFKARASSDEDSPMEHGSRVSRQGSEMFVPADAMDDDHPSLRTYSLNTSVVTTAANSSIGTDPEYVRDF